MNLDNRVSSSGSSINQTSVSPKKSHTVGNLSKYDEAVPLKQISLHQVIRGEITDLRNNEVTVTLQDNTTVTGKLHNGSMLSIGDTAAFRISSIQPHIELEALIPNSAVIENSTIQKALESAGLPKTEKNQLVVHELIANNMPINKQSIQTILSQSYQYKNAQISTLVLMNRHTIPITEETVTQFEAYRNLNHQLASKIDTFSESIPSLLQLLSQKSSSSAVSFFGNQLLGIFLSEDTLSSSTPNEATISDFTYEDKASLLAILDHVLLSENEVSAIQDGSAHVRNLVHSINQGIELAYQFDKENLKSFMDETMQTNYETDDAIDRKQIESKLSNIPKAMDSYDDAVIVKLFSKFSNMQDQNNELGSVLDSENRMELIKQLHDFPLSDSIKHSIQNGEITLFDTLHAIKSSIPVTSEDSVLHLFDSDVFKTLFKGHIVSNWTLHPANLDETDSVDHLYEKIYTQSKELDSFFKATLGNTDIGSSFSNQASDIKQNIDFMQLLNQMFSYIQLPIKLKEQTVHSELYVYTKKHSLKNNPESIRVLLHLDMDKLGSLDIHVALNQNQVNTKFYLPDKTIKNLFKDHISELTDALGKKGYTISTEFSVREQTVDIVKDFIQMDDSNNPVKRYSFDIRA
ncbi:MAG: flagellar hook-length control protein FliK [Velocimicrobium sp.]